MEEERLTLLAEARECMQLLLVEIRTMESFESLSSFVDIQATTETETIASKLNLSAVSWSPRNESFFSPDYAHGQEDYFEGPLSLNID